MKNLIHTLAILFLGQISLQADPENDNNTLDGYVFLGGALSAYIKDVKYEVTSVDNKYLYLTNGDKKKKTKPNASCSIRFEPAFSTKYIEARDSTFKLSSLAQASRESQAIQDSLEIPGSQLDVVVQDMLNDQTFHDDRVADTVHAKATLFPESDLSDVYCALIVRYQSIRTRTQIVEKPGAFVRVHFIGDLRQGQGTEIKIQKRLTPFVTQGTEFDLLFYHGQGEQIASSLSKGLKRAQLDLSKAQSKSLQ